MFQLDQISYALSPHLSFLLKSHIRSSGSLIHLSETSFFQFVEFVIRMCKDCYIYHRSSLPKTIFFHHASGQIDTQG